MPAPQSPRRREILDAAVVVLAGHGLGGSPTGASTGRPGSPEGSSSSAYFRSRAAPCSGDRRVRLSDQLVQDVEALSDTLAAGDHSVARAVRETGATLPPLARRPRGGRWPASSSRSPRPATTSSRPRWRAGAPSSSSSIVARLEAGGHPDDATRRRHRRGRPRRRAPGRPPAPRAPARGVPPLTASTCSSDRWSRPPDPA